MSQENAESVRRWFEAFSEEDFDSALELMHPDVLVVPPGGQPPYRGAESVRRWMEPDAFLGQEFEPLELVAGADQRILAQQRAMARGASSGIEVDVVAWSVWSFDEGGLITQLQIFLPHEEEKARQAAGL